MPSIKSRIAALANQLREMYPECDIPYDQLDPLSQALVDMANELTAQDKAELLEEMNQGGGRMSMEDLENMIRSITVDY